MARRKGDVMTAADLNARPGPWHLDRFVDFIDAKRRIGEAGFDFRVMGQLCKDVEVSSEMAWRVGCFTSVYSIAMGSVLWANWPYDNVKADMDGGSTELLNWLLKEHRTRILPFTKRERRCVYTPQKLARYLYSYAKWVKHSYPSFRATMSGGYGTDRDFYDALWTSLDKSVQFAGRYIIIRIIEALRQHAGMGRAVLYDIRSAGAWSVKKSLAYIYREHADTLLVQGADNDGLVQELADTLADTVKERRGWKPGYITLASAICEYRECYEGQNQYPGFAVDIDLGFAEKIRDAWPDSFDFKAYAAARKKLFHPRCVGEWRKPGWRGIREELKGVLRNKGYVWCDIDYEYPTLEKVNV